MPPFLLPLLSEGLELISNAVLTKGKDFIEKETGIKIPEDGKLNQDQLLQLKRYQMTHEEELARIAIEDNKLDLEQYKEEAKDRDSARERENRVNESVNASWLSKNTSSLIALTFVGTYLAINFGAMLGYAQTGDTIATSVLNNLTNITLLIIGYYYGASKVQKDIHMENTK